MDGWQLASSILLYLGIAGVVICLLLNFKVGRWILSLLLIGLFIFSLFEGSADWADLGSNTPLHKVSRFLLIAGSCCLIAALLIRWIHPLIS
jgi:hypothetical protein